MDQVFIMTCAPPYGEFQKSWPEISSSSLLLSFACSYRHLYKWASEEVSAPDFSSFSACSKRRRFSNLASLSMSVFYFCLQQDRRVPTSSVRIGSNNCGAAARGVCVQVFSVDVWCLQFIYCRRRLCEVPPCRQLIFILLVRLLSLFLFFLFVIARVCAVDVVGCLIVAVSWSFRRYLQVGCRSWFFVLKSTSGKCLASDVGQSCFVVFVAFHLVWRPTLCCVVDRVLRYQRYSRHFFHAHSCRLAVVVPWTVLCLGIPRFRPHWFFLFCFCS